MEEIRMRDQQLVELSEKIKVTLAGLDKSNRRQLDLEELDHDLADMDIVLDGFQIEIKMQNVADRRTYQAKYKMHYATFQQLKQEYEWKCSQSNKNELFAGAQPRGGQYLDMNSAEALMEHGLGVQQESKESLQSSLAMVADAQQIGRETATKLQNQTEQIETIYDDLEDIGDSLARSKRVMRRMARKLATDKYIWVVAFLVLAAIVAIIIVKAVDPSGGGSKKDAP